jgi:elongation factor P
MITTADFGKGVRILMNNEPYVILDVTMQTASGRGSQTMVKIKARNLLTGKFVTESVKNGSKFEQPDLKFSQVQYLYTEADAAVFMDQETYEQFSLPLESLAEQVKYLNETLKIKATYFNNNPVAIELPTHVELEVSSVEPGTRGNTATGTVTTKATLVNGMDVQVPLNVKSGDRILVATADDTYYQRVNQTNF